MHGQLIETQSDFDALCKGLSDTGLIGIDTEFLRVRTYYPKLCLLQIASDEQVFCIDPLYVDLDTGAFRQVLNSSDLIKVFHAGRQDIEVLYGCCGQPPRRIFDTQIAAAMSGLGDQIGYADLVAKVVGASLDKAHTRTDWCQRPLSAEQIQYAVDDVRYLGEIYRHLANRLNEKGRLKWVFEECELLADPALYECDPGLAYKRIGQGRNLTAVSQSVLKELAAWREEVSQNKDLPRNWIIRDSILADIAQAQPRDQQTLAAVEGVSSGFVKKYGTKVIDLIDDVRHRQHHPMIWKRGAPLNSDQRVLFRRIMAYLKKVSGDSGISISLLGTRQDVERLVRGRRDVNLVSGWRADLLGDELNAILAS